MPKIHKDILVTGGSGFVGRAVLQELHAEQIPFFYTYNRGPLDTYPGQGIKVDLGDESSLSEHDEDLEKITDLVHIAAFVPDKTTRLTVLEDLRANVSQNIVIIENLLSHLPNLKRIVFVSSCYAELSDPAIGFYGVGKRTLEEIVHQYARMQGIDSIALRFPQLYGPGESHGMYINKFINVLIGGGDIVLDENAGARKDALYIKDAAGAIKSSLFLNGNSTITVSSEKPYSVAEAADEVAAAVGVRSDRIQKPPHITGDARDIHFVSDHDQYGLQLHYSLKAGIKETVNYYKGKDNV